MKTPRRVGPVAAYVLHHTPYRDSGRIVEALTRDHGRLSLFAHGVRRPKSGLAAALQPFQRLHVCWSGRGEAPTLASAEIDTARPRLPAAHFMSGCYVNELMLKLTTRHDTHPELYDLYDATLASLAEDTRAERALRLFEKRLLDAVGFGLGLTTTAASRQPLDPRARYHFQPQVGAVEAAGDATGRLYSGAALLALARETIEDAQQLNEIKPLLRTALEACLDGRRLSTREVAVAVHRQQWASSNPESET